MLAIIFIREKSSLPQKAITSWHSVGRPTITTVLLFIGFQAKLGLYATPSAGHSAVLLRPFPLADLKHVVDHSSLLGLESRDAKTSERLFASRDAITFDAR